MGVGWGMRKAEARMEQHGRWVGSMTLGILPSVQIWGTWPRLESPGTLFTRQGRGQGEVQEPDTETLRAAGCRIPETCANVHPLSSSLCKSSWKPRSRAADQMGVLGYIWA